MTHPMTDQPRPETRLWNRFARRYAKSPVGDPVAYQYKLDETAKLLRPAMRVLEFGCGTGTTALTHAPSVAQIDAIDFSSAMIAIAREKALSSGVGNVNFEVAAFEDWPVPAEDGRYDMIMAHSILHLVADLAATLEHVRACLAPGGWFISSTVCIGDGNPLVASLLPLVGWTGLIPKVAPLTGKALLSKLQVAGFNIRHDWRPGPAKAIFIIAQAPE